MAKVVLDMAMSLDGFIAGPNDGSTHPLGVDGRRLHDWLAIGTGDPATYRPDGPSGDVFDELMATGAVIVGRRTFEIAGGWDGDHHDGVPIFVPTHRPPPDEGPHGADTAQHCLLAGLLDEMEIHLVPVLLGQGRPLFAHLGTEHIELELTRTVDAPGIVHLHYRVKSTS